MSTSRSARGLRAAALATVLGLSSLAASAAPTLTLDAAGRLLGATGVNVGGTAYDVRFSDGTCAGLYSGCDALSDFAFNTLPQAHAASLALVNQVFNAALPTDLDPRLIPGCEDSGVLVGGVLNATCYVLTPLRFTMDGNVATHVAVNDVRDFMDQAAAPDTQFVVGATQSLAGIGSFERYYTFAVWSLAGTVTPSPVPVPAPGSAALAALALLSLRAVRRR